MKWVIHYTTESGTARVLRIRDGLYDTWSQVMRRIETLEALNCVVTLVQNTKRTF